MTDAERLELEAYYDGELGRLGRWRFERRLRRSAELQAELRALGSFTRQVAELEAEAARGSAGSVGIWQSLAAALPAIDAQLADERARGDAALPQPQASPAPGPALLRWGAAAGAVAAAGLVALVLLLQSPSEVAPDRIATSGRVRYLDTAGRPYLLFDEASEDITIIWLMDEA